MDLRGEMDDAHQKAKHGNQHEYVEEPKGGTVAVEKKEEVSDLLGVSK